MAAAVGTADLERQYKQDRVNCLAQLYRDWHSNESERQNQRSMALNKYERPSNGVINDPGLCK